MIGDIVPKIEAGTALLTKVAWGVHRVTVTHVDGGTVFYLWDDGATGEVSVAEIGEIGDTTEDWGFVIEESP